MARSAWIRRRAPKPRRRPSPSFAAARPSGCWWPTARRAGTASPVEERYHHLLESQGLLARDVALETRPKDIEERLTLQDWMREVFEVGSGGAAARRGKVGGTGQLPGTGDLRKAWASFDDEELPSAAESLIRAFGFTQVERVRPADATGCDFLAWVTLAAGAEQIFIRCLRLEAAGEVEGGGGVGHETQDNPPDHTGPP